MKKVLGYLVVGVFALLSFMWVKTLLYFDNEQYVPTSPLPAANIDFASAVERLSTAVTFQTVSYEGEENINKQAFEQLNTFIETSFPTVHKVASLQVFNEFSLLYKIEGTDNTLQPSLFMGHLDVVPADEIEAWQHPPFSGLVTDDIIFGRGTLDDKVTVMALLEAIEQYLKEGKQPKRTLYFAFGHDEEIGGKNGAKVMAAHLRELGIRFEFILDEGGAVTQNLMAGVTSPLALIGIAEKGYANVHLTARAAGGHSSQPPAQTAAGAIGEAVVELERNQFPSDFQYLNGTLQAVGFSLPFEQRFALANQWLLGSIIESQLLSSPSTAASLRTSTAVTMLSGSSKSNILPSKATATINYRLLPGVSQALLHEHVSRALSNENIEVEIEMSSLASPVSSSSNQAFKLIEQTIRRMDSDILVAPYLVQGGTDASHYAGLSDSIFRFMMIRLDPVSMQRFHGIDEQIAIEDYKQAINFYYALIEQTAAGE